MAETKYLRDELLKTFESHLLERYETVLRSLVEPHLRGILSVAREAIEQKDDHIVFHTSSYENLLSFLDKTNEYITVKVSKRKLRRAILSALPAEQERKPRRQKKRRKSGVHYKPDEALEALGTLSSLPDYDGVSASDIAKYLEKPPGLACAIGMFLKKAKKRGGLEDFEYRDKKWYRTQYAGQPDDGKNDQPKPAPASVNPGSAYKGFAEAGFTVRLKDSGVLRALYEMGRFSIPHGFTYSENGYKRVDRILPALQSDIRSFLQTGGCPNGIVRVYPQESRVEIDRQTREALRSIVEGANIFPR